MMDASPRRGPATLLPAAAVVAGGVAILWSPFLPWVTGSSPVLGTASLTGFEGGRGVAAALGAGLASVALGARVLIGAGGRRFRRVGVQLGVLAGLAAGLVAWIAIRDAADPAVSLLVSRDEAAVRYAPGIGVWVLILGAVFVIAGSVGAGSLRRRPGRSKVRDASEETA